jgi:hypothetical protein
MTKDMDYYRTLDLREAARGVPADSARRQTNDVFHDLLKSIVVRHKTESISSQDLLAFLGEPDSVKQRESGEAWEYRWRGQHMGREYRGADVFVLVDDRVVAVEQHD